MISEIFLQPGTHIIGNINIKCPHQSWISTRKHAFTSGSTSILF